MSELKLALQALNVHLTQKQFIAFCKDIDNDGDGNLVLNEFLLAVRMRIKAASLSEGSDDPLVMATNSAWKKVLAFVEVDRKAWKTKIEKSFNLICPNGEEAGLIQLQVILSYAGIDLTVYEMRGYLEDIDDDGSGRVSLGELKTAITQRHKIFLENIDVRDELSGSDGSNGPGASLLAWNKIIALVTNRQRGNFEGSFKDTITRVFNQVDADGSGTIEHEESLNLVTHKILSRDSEGDIQKTSRLFNDDVTGKISLKNLNRVKT